MTTTITDYHELVQSYLALFQNPRASYVDLQAFYDEEVIWQEMPNLFAPLGRSNTFGGLLVSWRRGQEAVVNQKYTIKKVVVEDDSAVVELDWEGTITQSLGDIAAGTVMRSHVAILIEFRDGKIFHQRDYICYYPLEAAS